MALQIGQESEEERKKREALAGMYSIAAPATADAAGSSGPAPTNPFGFVNVTPVVSAPTLRDSGAGLMFNPEFAPRNEQINRSVLTAQSDAANQKLAAQAQYERAKVDAGTQQEQARQMLLQRMSGRGILRSSATADKSSELEGNYSKYLTDLANALAGQQSQVDYNTANRINSLYDQREALYGEQTTAETNARLAREQAEQERIARENAAAEQNRILEEQRIAYENSIAEQNRMLQEIANRPAPVINIPTPGPSPYPDPGPAPGPAPRQSAPAGPVTPDWSQKQLSWPEMLDWARQANQNWGSNAYSVIQNMINTNPQFSGQMQNTMGYYYGGATDMNHLLNWLTNPRKTDAYTGWDPSVL